jgi:hypothetical protein
MVVGLKLSVRPGKAKFGCQLRSVRSPPPSSPLTKQPQMNKRHKRINGTWFMLVDCSPWRLGRAMAAMQEAEGATAPAPIDAELDAKKATQR